MKEIFDDFEIINLMRDPLEPGLFLKARKPFNFKLRDLTVIALYSMLTGRRIKSVPDKLPMSRKIFLLYQRFKTHTFFI
ncbi:hypothetical protein HS7_13810 [Sulfolobales archaeon HS-7]|nr:hypothetical protein HS7_13810 [Sulfolobales archaeon HS-7]